MEKKLYVFTDADDSRVIVKLSKSNIEFLKWLEDHNMISYEWDYDPIDELTDIEEF